MYNTCIVCILLVALKDVMDHAVFSKVTSGGPLYWNEYVCVSFSFLVVTFTIDDDDDDDNHDDDDVYRYL